MLSLVIVWDVFSGRRYWNVSLVAVVVETAVMRWPPFISLLVEVVIRTLPSTERPCEASTTETVLPLALNTPVIP